MQWATSQKWSALVLAILAVALVGGSYWYGAYQAQRVGRDFCDVINTIIYPRIPPPPPNNPIREKQYNEQQKFVVLAHHLECGTP